MEAEKKESPLSTDSGKTKSSVSGHRSLTNTSKVYNFKKKTYAYPLLTNISDAWERVPLPKGTSGNSRNAISSSETSIKGNFSLICGDFQYFHYGCDNFIDNGWGCAYRTLQTMCSWIIRRRYGTKDAETITIPSLLEIQQILVDLQDKQSNFIGSREWIGAIELSYVVDTLYNVPCKILHIQKGSNQLPDYVYNLECYFKEIGGFAMMGGDVDVASKGIIGIHCGPKAVHLLIVVSSEKIRTFLS